MRNLKANTSILNPSVSVEETPVATPARGQSPLRTRKLSMSGTTHSRMSTPNRQGTPGSSRHSNLGGPEGAKSRITK